MWEISAHDKQRMIFIIYEEVVQIKKEETAQ